jgi:hypothetical protein
MSPIDFAIFGDHASMVEFLVSKGADVNKTDG